MSSSRAPCFTIRSSDTSPDPNRFAGIVRPYAQADVSGSGVDRHSAHAAEARRRSGSGTCSRPKTTCGSRSAHRHQAVQMARAGSRPSLERLQVAAGRQHGRPDVPGQSLYPVESVPAVVRRSNAALVRADQIEQAEDAPSTIVSADFGRRGSRFRWSLNAFELMKAMIEAGVPGSTSKTSSHPRRSAGTWGQGARSDGAVHPHAHRGPSGSRCHGRGNGCSSRAPIAHSASSSPRRRRAQRPFIESPRARRRASTT